MVPVVERLREEVAVHVVSHRDWLRGRCRLVRTRSFPWAGFEYPLPQWESERESELAS